MAKPTRIYTRTGDDGTTGLVGGQRVKKHAPRIDAYGTIDETSSAIGVVRAALTTAMRSSQLDHARVERTANRLDAWLAWTQHVLFNIGSDLATLPADRWAEMPIVSAADVTALERAIDEAQLDLPALSNFILPAGAPASAALHVARTTARRAERLLTSLAESEDIGSDLIAYVNRLSDALFVWARWINWAQSEPEALWNAKSAAPEPRA